MKYRWKKEMPFAKIGDEVKINKTSERDSGWNFSDKTLYMSDNFFSGLLSNGWIEEAKPREWTLLKAHNGKIMNVLEGFIKLYSDGKFVGISECIKVREVLE